MVGFEQLHTASAVEVGGAPHEHVFLLLELSAIRELHRLRTAAGPRSVASLPDPIGEPEQVFAETARVIDAVTGALAAAVVPGRSVVSA